LNATAAEPRNVVAAPWEVLKIRPSSQPGRRKAATAGRINPRRAMWRAA
jgi:hypothetical protein